MLPSSARHSVCFCCRSFGRAQMQHRSDDNPFPPPPPPLAAPDRMAQKGSHHCPEISSKVSSIMSHSKHISMFTDRAVLTYCGSIKRTPCRHRRVALPRVSDKKLALYCCTCILNSFSSPRGLLFVNRMQRERRATGISASTVTQQYLTRFRNLRMVRMFPGIF